ncbi:maleylpyruvate isomerase family mycothiol-dependent enzyme [Micromonospora sonneratiae]|uniref:Maleylpyruvate isomerase N-terminal domain-containing protein n=1 Tax=Micromonospora sonneratiae TaxID=1184706 RepID=A0ABW3YBP5_9ACTN
MTAVVTPTQWQAVRAALNRAGEGFAELICAVPDPTRRVTAHWSVADTAAHIASITRLYTAIVRFEESTLPVPDLAEQLRQATVDTIADVNDLVLRHLTERDPGRLAEQIRTEIADILATSADLDPSVPVPWLGDSRVPIAGVFAHLTNELLIHGYDIATATGADWSIPAADSALFWEVFLVKMTQHSYGRLLDTDEPPSSRRIAVEFRSDHTTPVTLVLRDGLVSVEEPGDDPDVRLLFDPVVLNLMLFGRVSRLRAVLTRKVVIRGRRPWLLLPFLRVMRLPS